MPTTIITPDRVNLRRANLQPGAVLDIQRGSHTGDAVLTTVATVTVPAGIMGPSGIALVAYAFTIDATPSAAWSVAVEFDGSDIFTRDVATGFLHHANHRFVANQGAEDSQVICNSVTGTDDTGDVAAVATLATDTSHEFDITARVQLDASDTARTVTCEFLAVRILGITGE